MPPRTASNRSGRPSARQSGRSRVRPPTNPPLPTARRRKVPELPPEIPPSPPPEEEEEKVEKQQEDSWLNHLPPIFNPDQEIHDRLTFERHQKRAQKVKALCACELEAMFKCAMETRKLMSDPEYAQTRAFRRIHALFRNGAFTPDPPGEDDGPVRTSRQTVLAPVHSLAVQHYLRFKSVSMLSDLSNVFGVELSDKKLDDPNVLFARMLETLEGGMREFLSPYRPYEPIPFPFIVCIIGPRASGKTTVAQFIRRAFDVHVIDCIFVPGEKKSSGKMSKTNTAEMLDASMDIDVVPEYPLEDAIPVRYSDDKSAVSQIVSVVKDSLEDGKGFVICGYPNQKNQLAALEKAMSAAGANMHSKQAVFLRTMSVRGRAQQPSINGVIFTVYSEPNRERIVDPETGYVYKHNFNMPGTADFLGVPPIEFAAAREKIEGRLEEFITNEYPILAPKALQQYVQFEAQVKKTLPAVSIGLCESAYQMVQHLDSFMCDLYKRNIDWLPNEVPIATLMRPQSLVKPNHCFTAISTWYHCLEEFGSTIADQSNLVSTLGSKVDFLMKAATERYQLLISKSDKRLRLCQDFMARREKDMSAHFRNIWEMSIAIRNKNFELIDEVIDKSGLIELLLELRKSPKIVFIALVHRMLFVKWFVEKFGYIMRDDEFEHMKTGQLNKLDVVTCVDLPKYDYRLSSPPANAVAKSVEAPPVEEHPVAPPPIDISGVKTPHRPMNPKTPRPEKPPRVTPKMAAATARRTDDDLPQKQMPGVVGFDYLIENLKNLSVRPQDSIFFDSEKACRDLEVESFNPNGITFDDTVAYANAFFVHIEKSFSDPLLQNEVRSSCVIFEKFTTLCHRKETSMVKSVFDLRDSLTNFAYAKCTHEMETFSERFRIVKRGEDLASGVEPFEYDTRSVSRDIQSLAELMVSLETPVTSQSLVDMETVFKLATEITNKGIQYSSDKEFLQLAKEIIPDEAEYEQLELCLRIMECVECFDAQQFLACFPRTREDSQKLTRIFATKPAPPPISTTTVLGTAKLATVPNEEEEEGGTGDVFETKSLQLKVDAEDQPASC